MIKAREIFRNLASALALVIVYGAVSFAVLIGGLYLVDKYEKPSNQDMITVPVHVDSVTVSR